MEVNNRFDFTYDVENIDRRALLEEAARRFNAQHGHLGGKFEKFETSPEADLALGIIDDEAEFNGFPRLYKITEADFVGNKLPVPVRFKELSQYYNFYDMRFPLLLLPRRDWAFNYLEMRVEMKSPNALPHMQPVAYELMPEKQFQDVVSADGRLVVRIGESFKFSAKAAPPEVDVGIAKVGAEAGVHGELTSDAGVVVGPFLFRLRKAKIISEGIDGQVVFWRLDGSQFFQENRVLLLVIVQIPKEVKELQVKARFQAARHFNLANSNLQRAVEQLPEAIRTFFKKGAPIGSSGEWDLAPLLEKFG